MKRAMIAATIVLGASGAAWADGTSMLIRCLPDGTYTISGNSTDLSDHGVCARDGKVAMPGPFPSQPHHYTIAEIDRMRAALAIILRRPVDYFSVPTFEFQIDKNEIEQTLRTYVAAGITAEELEAAAKPAGSATGH